MLQEQSNIVLLLTIILGYNKNFNNLNNHKKYVRSDILFLKLLYSLYIVLLYKIKQQRLAMQQKPHQYNLNYSSYK